MKLHEILNEDQLDELDLKHALASLLIGASTFSINPHTPTKDNTVTAIKAINRAPDQAKQLAAGILKKYKINPEVALEISKLAIKHEKADFPKAPDILSVIGIESSFNPEAKSKLKHDPALGLMQVRPGIWKLDKKELHSIENQISSGTEILNSYYVKLKDKTKALHAFNMGLTDFNKGKTNPNYIDKFQKERTLYASL